MKRLCRWLCDGIAVLCLSLSLAAAVLWFRTTSGTEDFFISRAGWGLDVLAVPGRLAFTVSDYNQPAYLDFTLSTPESVRTQYDYSLVSHERTIGFAGYPQRSDFSDYLIAMHFHPWFVWDRNRIPGLRGLRTHSIVWAWYQDAKYRTQKTPVAPWDNLGTFGRGISVPTWYAVVLFAIPGMLWLSPKLKRVVLRTPNGFCARCGYDLRATPWRCPECGMIPAKKALI